MQDKVKKIIRINFHIYTEGEKSMKEIKDKKIDFRVSASEKERIKEYAEEHNIKVGELIRVALNRFMAIEDKKEEEK